MTGEEDGSTMAERTYEAVKSFKERSEEIENMGDSISEGFDELAYNQRVLMEQITTGLKAHNSHDEKLDELSNDTEEVKDSVEEFQESLEDIEGSVQDVNEELAESKRRQDQIYEEIVEDGGNGLLPSMENLAGYVPNISFDSFRRSDSSSRERENLLDDEDKRDSGILIGAGIAALGLGTGAFAGAAAYEEINESRGISTVDAPESYPVFHDEMDFLGFADELQDSNQDLLVNIGDDMENLLQQEPYVDYGLGLKDGNLFLDWGNNARRYSMGGQMAEIEQTVDDYLEQ